jgi:diphosphomevalonate decarboxylase
MHKLFETSTPSFGYMTVGSHEVLEDCQSLWNKWQDGPLVTMDAGANVHLLFQHSKTQQFDSYKEHFSKKFKVIAHKVTP